MNLEYRYGHYILKLRYAENEDFCQVSMNDIAEKWPLIWFTGMNKAQANGAIKLFEAIGYFDMPMEV